MIEETILKKLASTLTGISCVMEIPTPMPETFVSIERTGSQTRNRLTTATFAVQSWAASLYAAAALNERVKSALVDELIEEADVIKVSLNSDYNFTDTSTKRYRYQAVVEITYY